MSLESFYGGKQGISPVIKESFWFIDDNITFDNDDVIQTDFVKFILNKAEEWKNNKKIAINFNTKNPNSQNNINLDNIVSDWLLYNKTLDNDSKQELQDYLSTFSSHIMNRQFSLGDEYTNVWYSEYCIIDSPNKQYVDNGKLFRRTLNSRNEKNNTGYAEYVGTLRGPAGQIPNVNITSLKKIENNFAERKLFNPNISYPQASNGDLLIKEFTMGDGIEIPTENNTPNSIKYSWYQVDNTDGTSSQLFLGFAIPAPQISAEIDTVAWNAFPAIDFKLDTDHNNPFHSIFDIKIPRGVKGTSINNVRLARLGDFTNIVELFNFFENSAKYFFDNNHQYNCNLFNKNIDSYLNYFNETVDIDLVSGESIKKDIWDSHLEEDDTDQACWFYFLEKIIGNDNIFKKIENTLLEKTVLSDDNSMYLFFNDNNRVIINRNDNQAAFNTRAQIIADIKDLPILVYDIIFYNLIQEDDSETSENENSSLKLNGKYEINTFFLSSYDFIKNMSVNPQTGITTIEFYYQDNISFNYPVIIGSSINEDNDLTFTYSDQSSNTVQLNVVNRLTLENGLISYSTSNPTPGTTNNINLNDDKSLLKTYSIEMDNGSIYVISEPVKNTSENNKTRVKLGDIWSLSTAGILPGNLNPSTTIPKEVDTDNYAIQDWVDYLNNYYDGTGGEIGTIWVGSDSVGGYNNWYIITSGDNGTGTKWAYMGQTSNWPYFFLKNKNTSSQIYGQITFDNSSFEEKLDFNPFNSYYPSIESEPAEPETPEPTEPETTEPAEPETSEGD